MNNRSLASSNRVIRSCKTRNGKTYPCRQRQSGSILVLSLLIMVALTIIGMSGIGGSISQEKMAVAMKDRNTAFQSAEAALKRGQQFFVPLVGTAAFDGTRGQYGQNDADPDLWSETTWSDSNSKSYTDHIVSVADPEPVPHVQQQPRYILKYLGDIKDTQQKSLNIGGYGEQSAGSRVSNFRVTARGVGSDKGRVVILEAYFGKKL